MHYFLKIVISRIINLNVVSAPFFNKNANNDKLLIQKDFITKLLD